MKKFWEKYGWIVWVLVVVAFLAGLVFVWPGLKFERVPASDIKVPAPTRDPAVLALATGQAQQAEALEAMATSLAQLVAIQPVATAMSTVTPIQPAAPAVDTPVPQVPSGTSDVQEAFRAGDALAYPVIVLPDASRQTVFPDVPYGNRPALVAYESPFEDGDFCDNTPCGMDIPQYYYRVMTAGQVTIPDLGVNCVVTETKGCAVIVINHFGPTAMYRGNTIDHGFTIAGRVWDMSSPELVTLAAQALLDHYMLRMTATEDGANCGVITACESVEWHVVIVGNGEAQVHWTGFFRR